MKIVKTVAAILPILISFGCLATPAEHDGGMTVDTALQKKARQSKQTALYPLYNDVKSTTHQSSEQQATRGQHNKPMLLKSLPSALLARPQR
ncbi:hypothetical protein [Aestuariibacter sp. A3R04]|uniref:hypothetical protein n=1 Tax=Aestuariibacter sp. A3R04 TaxID=2841571 RepID=UPI001C08E323|nr:hypothetical protein [Aestuariibacter sp. A3R04]MBU3023186.1 hypothetical protein [Aestuariibacter sp. A3R04]